MPRIQGSRPLRSLPPPLRPIWTPSALLPNYTVAIGRENNAQTPTCYVTIQYILPGRSLALPTEVLAHFLSHQCPPFSEIQELAGKGRLHTTDEDISLLVRNPTPAHYSLRPAGRAACLLGDEPIRIYVPLLMRSGIMQARHSTASSHLGTARTLRICERFYWWIGMSTFTRWWLRHCLKCQVRKAPRLTFRWPVISIPLPPGPGIAVSVDYFGPLPITPRGTTYIFLFTDRFSRFTAEGTANILIHRYISLWGCPRSTLSDKGLQFCSKLPHVVYELFGVEQIATSSYHPSGNGGVERVNYAMAQMLAMVVNERQDDWDAQLSHVEFAYNNSVSAATGLAPNEVHTTGSRASLLLVSTARGRRPSVPGPRPPHILRSSARTPTACQRHCSRDACLNRFPCGTVKINPSDALRQVPNFVASNWVWLYNTAFTIRQIAKDSADAKVLNTKFVLNCTGPYKILAVGPCPSSNTPEGSPLREKLLYLTSSQTCPARMRTAASPSSAASSTPTPMTASTCLSTFRTG